jgi:hypothetical protein
VFKREKFSLAGARFTGIARAWVCVRGACCSNCDAATTVEVVAAPQVLLDTKVGNASGGTGKTFDWSIAAQVQQKGVPVFVAGGTLSRTMRAEQFPQHLLAPLLWAAGLKPSNVAEAIGAVRPLAVDVSSGVESDESGKKDLSLVNAFCSISADPILIVVAVLKEWYIVSIVWLARIIPFVGWNFQVLPKVDWQNTSCGHAAMHHAKMHRCK